MKQSTIPTVVIIITAIAALLVFASSDHSGLSVTDCTLSEVENQPGTYNLTYTLLTGRHFNLLDCQYTLYSEDNKIIKQGNTKLSETYMGSYPITDTISIKDEKNLNATHAEIVIYTQIVREENGVNKTSMEKSYSKTFDL